MRLSLIVGFLRCGAAAGVEAALLDVLERREVVLVLFFLVVVFLLLDADLLKASRASARVTSAATVSLLRETRLSPSVTKSPQRLDFNCIILSS